MPRLVAAPTTVVDLPGQVKIDEFFGGASCNPCPAQAPISVAHVKAKAGFAEDWQAPAFDEYVLVLKGAVTLEHAHGEAVKVAAGQAVFLPKGERVRWVFNEDAEYVPICLPAFSPFNIFREEGAEKRPDHDKHTTIYHCVQKPLWEEAKASGKLYYPPTYEADGFTHATADPAFLVGVLNHFYKDSTAEWLCLGMTRASLAAAEITLKFEDPSPVGNTPALNKEQSGGERFPHIYGGIPPTGVVFEERVIKRAADGTFEGIEGLC
tara:strand:- start:154 stop:951 length:798 start_codon:yes stop_codon:yes gene_type:complete